MGVLLYVLKRLGISLILLLIASFFVYAGVRVTVDPTAGKSLSKDKEAREREIQRLGLDKPLIEQYKVWISGAIRGDLGKGDRDGELVTTKLKRGFEKTFELAIWGALVAGCFGITFGVIAAIRRNHPIDYALSAYSYLGVAIPTFAFAYVLINLFSLWLPELFGSNEPWLFTTGNVQASFGRSVDGLWTFESIVDYLRHMLMPVMVLSIQLIASWSRYQRASMIESLQSDYIRTAQAKGMSKFRVYSRHALRNSQVPMVTVIALDIGLLFQGLVITEFVFSISGMGAVFVNALNLGDATTLVGWTMVTAFIVIIANLMADLLLPVVDPRIRTQ